MQVWSPYCARGLKRVVKKRIVKKCKRNIKRGKSSKVSESCCDRLPFKWHHLGDNFVVSDLYRHQWRPTVQHLANVFWDKWRCQFLSTLQTRHKWQSSQPNVNPGTVVVPKDIHFPRNEWPLGLVIKVFPSTDGKVCTVEIRVAGPHGTKLFTRPFSQIVVLFIRFSVLVIKRLDVFNFMYFVV